MTNRHRVVSPMTGESTNSEKMMLAIAIANGTPVAEWALLNGVNERTAYRWAAEPEVRSEIESIRSRALRRGDWPDVQGRVTCGPVDKIFELGEHATSESVRLSASASRDLGLHHCLQFLRNRNALGQNSRRGSSARSPMFGVKKAMTLRTTAAKAYFSRACSALFSPAFASSSATKASQCQPSSVCVSRS